MNFGKAFKCRKISGSIIISTKQYTKYRCLETVDSITPRATICKIQRLLLASVAEKGSESYHKPLSAGFLMT